jgi:hypothetical protein
MNKERIKIWDELYQRPLAKAAMVAVWTCRKNAVAWPVAAKQWNARGDTIASRFGVRDYLLRFGPANI